MRDIEYLRLLSTIYPNVQAAATEYINLNAILNLPKPTEHFLSDIHGEHDAFMHFLKSGSGVIRSKIEEALPNYSKERKDLLATLIYYPKEKMEYLYSQGIATEEYVSDLLIDLTSVARLLASKHSSSVCRKRMSKDFAYIIEELMKSDYKTESKEVYFHQIINSIIKIGKAKDFVCEIAYLIQNLAVDRLHILGDIFDRGNGACRIMEKLTKLPNVDITWGNHDILYMGASAGNFACIANVIRNSCRYNHLSTIEDGYGISLRPLVTFAMKAYKDDPCTEFIPNPEEAKTAFEDYDSKVIAKMHKAITIIQLKAEGQIIRTHRHYKASALRKLSRVDFDKGVFFYNGNEYKLKDTNFPTINPADPEAFSEEERNLLEKLAHNFRHSEKFHTHVRFLLNNGSIYLRYNGNLLYHGCIPTNSDGSYLSYTSSEKDVVSGRAYMDYCDRKVRQILLEKEENSDQSDFLWYLWCCPNSPLYGKENIATFERYFLDSEVAKQVKEEKNSYYTYINNEDFVKGILKEFKLDSEKGVIINGHMPVKIKKGESPIKANGRLLIIDGGISKAYQKVTGIAGYTLTFSSHALRLVQHQGFDSKDICVKTDKDIVNSVTDLKLYKNRLLVKDTDEGKKILEKANAIKDLISAYRDGLIATK